MISPHPSPPSWGQTPTYPPEASARSYWLAPPRHVVGKKPRLFPHLCLLGGGWWWCRYGACACAGGGGGGGGARALARWRRRRPGREAGGGSGSAGRGAGARGARTRSRRVEEGEEQGEVVPPPRPAGNGAARAPLCGRAGERAGERPAGKHRPPPLRQPGALPRGRAP